MSPLGTLSLWSYIPLHAYAAPTEPARETVRMEIRGLWRQLRVAGRSDATAFVQHELHSAPDRLLDEAAPAPSWDAAARALADTLEQWFAADSPDPCGQVLVGAPGCRAGPPVAALARERRWHLVEPPGAEEILCGGAEWIARLKEIPEGPLAIPRLERCYLRHPDGLTLMRRLLEWIWTSRCRCLIGCDGWAWAYLTKFLQIDSFLPTSLALHPFDGERFNIWFRDLCLPCQTTTYVFRQSDSGEAVLVPAGEGGGGGRGGDPGVAPDGGRQVSNFLRQLAARSQGLPGIGWAIWRQSLQIAPDQPAPADARAEATSGRSQTLWVRPWSQVNLPSLPAGAGATEAFLLHTLLLHAGLPDELLPRVLSLSPSDITRGLRRLAAAGLIRVEAGIWGVTPLGYPAVRQFLRSEGYLMDAL